MRPFLLLVLVLIQTSSAFAQTGPEAAARAFFQSVAARRYAESWRMLTPDTQASFATAVAGDAKMPAAAVRKLFDANDPRLVGGFWESFRGAMKPEQTLQSGLFKAVSDDGHKAGVRLDDKTVLLMFNAGQGWKVGWQETFQPSMGYRATFGSGGSWTGWGRWASISEVVTNR